jgi:hypothetical protein
MADDEQAAADAAQQALEAQVAAAVAAAAASGAVSGAEHLQGHGALTLQQLQASYGGMYGHLPLESPMFLPVMPVSRRGRCSNLTRCGLDRAASSGRAAC